MYSPLCILPSSSLSSFQGVRREQNPRFLPFSLLNSLLGTLTSFRREASGESKSQIFSLLYSALFKSVFFSGCEERANHRFPSFSILFSLLGTLTSPKKITDFLTRTAMASLPTLAPSSCQNLVFMWYFFA
jgi:hypothetical protein